MLSHFAHPSRCCKTTAMSLKRTTLWRWAVACGVLALAAAPVLPLLVAAMAGPSKNPLWTDSFIKTVAAGLLLGLGVTGVSLAVGLPLGLLAALYRFPGRLPLILFQALPLLLPSFLLALGWRYLVVSGRLPGFSPPRGFGWSVFVLGFQAVPLPLFAAFAACRNLTASQIDAARLHGGERDVLKLSAAACAPVAVVAALLAGVLSLTDPGALGVFRCRSVAMEIRTNFDVLDDKVLAARQCLVMGGLALLLTAPVLWAGLRRLAAAVLARQVRPAAPYPHRPLGRLTLIGLITVTVLGVGLPVLGLCLPAVNNPQLARAAEYVWDTALPSLAYTAGAGTIAAALAIGLALVTARQRRLQSVVLGGLLALLAFPPALGALGVVHAAAQAPAALDWLTRSQLTVALVLGLRFLPVATVAMMRAVGSLSPSWTDAAEVHGVSRVRLLGRVILPVMTPAILIGVLLVMVLAAADVTTTLLLHPPGRQSLPLAIFTVMANAPEGLVASLCLLYFLGVLLLMVLASQLPRWWPRRLS